MTTVRFSEQVVPDFETPAGLERLTFPAMGTRVTVLAPRDTVRPAGKLVETIFAEWEDVFSRFRPNSELSYVNARAGQPVMVTTLFATVLNAAIEAARATDGIYDPTMLRQIVHAGYDRTFAEIPASRPAPDGSANLGGGWRAIRFDPAWRTVTLPHGLALDFGGIAKGMAVDAAIERLDALHLEPVAVEAGGDLRVIGVPPDRPGWPVAVELRSGTETITLYEGALATSSRSRRHWKLGDRIQHHILDPRTGEPADSDLWSVTAITSRCAQADVAAKVAFILGAERGGKFLGDRGLSGLLVTNAGERQRIGPWREDRPGSGR